MISINRKRSIFFTHSSIILDLHKFDSQVRNLGVILDNKLEFNKQINKVCRGGYNLLRNLRRISGKLSNISLKTQIIQSCILSHVDYCNSLYTNLPDIQIKKLQRLINSSLRFIHNVKPSDDYSITALMKQSHFLPVKARIDYKINLLVYKCLNTLAPEYLTELLNLKNTLPSLRIYKDKFLLEQPKLHLSNQKNRSFSQSAPYIWNKLPLNIRESETLSIFKNKLKTYLFSEYLPDSI